LRSFLGRIFTGGWLKGGAMLTKELELAMQQLPKLTVRQLATQIGMKVRTFYRHWRETNTPKKLLEKKKVEFAKRYLITNCDKKIAEIARELQFCDHYYFSKWFRRNVGVSPQQYRMMTHKEREALERKKERKLRRKKEA
jgi:AraC-like DNA-binding protein